MSTACGDRRPSSAPIGSSGRCMPANVRIYYKYEGEPAGQPQTQHGGRAGVLQQGGRRHEDRDRDGSGAMGTRWPLRARSSASRFRCSWSGSPTTRSHIVGPSWRHSARAASPARRRRPISAGRCWPRDPTATAAWVSRFPRRSKSPPRTTIQIRARLGAQSRAASPDRHRPGSAPADGDGRRLSRHRRRLHGRRLEFRRGCIPVHRGAVARRRKVRVDRRRTSGVPQPDTRRAMHTISAIPGT